ncbi:MAG TPA: hypothetical protein DCY27_06025 [Desulfobacterales bacterium]|nr:hypothetical protein [Desulfobacterales bacterium]
MRTQGATNAWRDLSYKQLALCLLRNSQSEVLRELGSEGRHAHHPYYQALHLALEDNLQEALEGLRPLVSQGHPEAQLLGFRLLIHQAKAHFQQQDFEALSQVLDEALQLIPDNDIALEELIGFKEILPYCYLKAGKRQEAENLWHQDLWSQGGPAIHKMAILYYQWANHAEEQMAQRGEGSHEELDDLWKKTIAFWVGLASSENFWPEWSRGRLNFYGAEPKAKELAELKRHILEDLLSGRFRHFLDMYINSGHESHAGRHRRYLSLLRREKQAASTWQKLLPRLTKAKQTWGLELTQKVPLEPTVRALQQSEGHDPCFRDPNQEHCPQCSWEALCRCHDLGAEPVLCLEFFGGPLMAETMGLTQFVRQVVEIQSSGTTLDEDVERMGDYLSPLGLAVVLLEERLSEQVFQELASLESDLRTSPRARWLEAAAWAEQGRRLEYQGLDKALEAWEKASNIMQELKRVNSAIINRRLTLLEEELGGWVADGCIREARASHQAGRTDEAIDLLKRGLEIAPNEDLKAQLADLYCEKGRAYLDKKQYQSARQEFDKALAVKPGYLKAKQGMGTSYNNEGVSHHDAGRHDDAIRMQRKALEYDPNNHTCRENIAGSLNSKGVRKIDVELDRAYTREQKLAIMMEALQLFKEAHEYDPNNESVIQNHNKLLEVLKNIRW